MRVTKSKKKGTRDSTLEGFLQRQAAAKAALPSKEEVKVEAKIKPPPRAVKNVRDLIYCEESELTSGA
jgi:hypothetical protein